MMFNIIYYSLPAVAWTSSKLFPASKPSICEDISRETPTAIIKPVPPMARELFDPNTPDKVNTTGKAAMNANANAPMHVTLLTTLRTYLSVSLPGRMPGMYEPFLRKLFARFSGSI